MWLLGRSPVISAQFLQFCILRCSRAISAQRQPTDSLAAHLAGPQSSAPNRPITRQAHSCPAQLHSWPTNLPNSPPNNGKPSPASAKPPEAVSKFHQPRHSEVYEPLRKSPTFSIPSIPPPGLRQAPSVPLLLSKPRASPTRFAAPPLGSQRSQLSRAGFNRSPVTFHTQVSSDAQFRASAANAQSLRLHTAPTLRPHRAHTAPALSSVVHLLQPA